MNDEAKKPRALITEDGSYPLDLTGPRSHTLVIEPGVGGLSIGPASLGKKVNLHVEPEQRINWRAFDAFATPAGSPWPRWLYYSGGDSGFLTWASERPIEGMEWTPILPADMPVDASKSRIGRLTIKLSQTGGRLRLTLPNRETSPYFRLSVMGNLARFSANGDMPLSLALVPRTSPRKNGGSFQLPDMGALHQVTDLSLRSEPMTQPISLQCLSRFPNLKSLSLYGSFSNLDQLAGQPQLKNLHLRYMPDLGGLPALNVWPELDSFIAFNVEEAAGKRLRQQVKAHAAVRPWANLVSVSQLRKPEWWAAEYGRPFSSWPARLAKLANAAYDAALAALAHARSLAEAEAALIAFAARFNTLKGIETPERDDLGEAVWQLSQSEHAARLGVTEEMAQSWFDAVRDY